MLYQVTASSQIRLSCEAKGTRMDWKQKGIRIIVIDVVKKGAVWANGNKWQRNATTEKLGLNGFEGLHRRD